MFHSIYGTQSYRTESASLEDLPVSGEELRDLIEMEVANYIEFMPRLDFTTEELDKFQSRVESAKDLLTGPAHEAVLEAIAAKRLQISGG